MNKHTAIDMVIKNFRYVNDPDNWYDNWRVQDADKVFKGDCDDFSLALLWELSDKSWFKFWFYLITMQAVIWHCKTTDGQGHAVLWFRGYWADNIWSTPDRGWYKTKSMPHKRRFPYPFASVALKMLITKLLTK